MPTSATTAAPPGAADTADDTPLARATLRRVSLRLLPFLFILYIANYLDRTNVAMAALQMNRDLRFSATAYGLGAGIFFVGYSLFEIPSNLILARVGARRWIARIMITWGLIASAMMFVRTPQQFYALRFLLGAAEGGFFPGIVYYLSQWFPAPERARAVARFGIAIPLSGAIGNPLGAALLGLDGARGLAGWQWLFLLEGIPSVLLGLAVLALLTDRPAEARWLPDAQRAWLAERMRRDADAGAGRRDPSLRSGQALPPLRALAHPEAWMMAIAYFLLSIMAYAYIFWAPTIVRDALHATPMTVGLILAGIACLAALGMLLGGASADRRGEHALHVGAASLVSALGFVGAALLPTPLGRIGGLAVAFVGVIALFAPFWSLTSMLLRGSAAAAAIALVSAIGQLGGFAGPYALGWLKDATGGTRGAFLACAALGVITAALTLGLRRRVALGAPGGGDPG